MSDTFAGFVFRFLYSSDVPDFTGLLRPKKLYASTQTQALLAMQAQFYTLLHLEMCQRANHNTAQLCTAFSTLPQESL